jgi:uncharacterized membrane protein
MEIFSLLWGTLLLRPYVFVFLAFFLSIAICHWGLARSLLFTVIAYTVAFISEYSSTRNGFPYGFYSYIEETRHQELWISNVPFMDSLSFTFLSYISLTLALVFRSPLKGQGWDIRIDRNVALERSWSTIFLAAFLFMMLDVIIDPVAFLGDRWFLGKIYTYKEAGEYFHIPLTNFAGWFIVGSSILFCWTRFDSLLDGQIPLPTRSYYAQAMWGPVLYFGVLAFNLAVTVFIGEYQMALSGLAISSITAGALTFKIRKSRTIIENG